MLGEQFQLKVLLSAEQLCQCSYAIIKEVHTCHYYVPNTPLHSLQALAQFYYPDFADGETAE